MAWSWRGNFRGLEAGRSRRVTDNVTDSTNFPLDGGNVHDNHVLGFSTASQVELITRSGTNSYHGNVFEYHRDTDLDANYFCKKEIFVDTPSGVDFDRSPATAAAMGPANFGEPINLLFRD